MINNLYTVLTIALASVLFAFGLLFYSLCRNAETPVYKTALRMMTFAYCFFGLVNVLEMWSRSAFPNDNDDVMLFQTVTLVVAVSQAFLFTYTLILLIRAAFVTRKRVVRELVALLTVSAALVAVYFVLPAAWVKLSVHTFILFYICLLIRYTRLFVITYRDCLRKMDNFFSGREADNLRWVKFSFYAALSIGLLFSHLDFAVSQFNSFINSLNFNILSLFSLLKSKCSKSLDLCCKSTFSIVSINFIFSSVRL